MKCPSTFRVRPSYSCLLERKTLMKLRALFSVALLSAASVALPARGQDAPTRVAVANPGYIINQMQETKDMKDRLEAERKQLAAEEKSRAEQLDAAKKDRDNTKPDAPQYQQKNQSLMKSAIEFRAWRETNIADMDHRQKIAMRNLFQKIESACQEV